MGIPTHGKKIFILKLDSFLLFQAACGVEAVSVGAILSEYQRIRVEHV